MAWLWLCLGLGMLPACVAPAQGPSLAVDAGVDASPVLFDTGPAADVVDDAAVDVADAAAEAGAADTALLDVADSAPDAIADVAIDAGPANCDDAQKRCPSTFSYVGNGGEASVEVRGSWNGWKAGVPMQQSNGTWTATVALPWNASVQYKFHAKLQAGGEQWLADPTNANTTDDGFGGKNSVLTVAACDPWTCAGPETVCGLPQAADAFDWRDAVMYFVFVDRFFDGNKTNNQPSSDPAVAPIANWHGGDWAGVQQKLQDGWFAKLGVNVLWLTVPMDGPDAAEFGDDGHKYTAYHGYWPRDVSKPQSRFGSMAELQQLVTTAHQQGIRIVLDYAMNHVHISSPVYLTHKDDGWFHPLQVNGQDCVCGSSVCPWEGPTMTTCAFTNYLPDFNFDHAGARQASVDNALWWLQQTGADGLRLDAIKHVEGAWLTDLRARLTQEREAKTGQHPWLVGETFSGDQGFLKSFVDPCAKLDGQFDFAERAQIVGTVLLRQGKLQDLAQFLDGNDGFFGPDAVMSTFVGNHDLPRAIHFAQDQPLWTDAWANGKDKNWNNQPAVVTEQSAYERLALAMTVLFTGHGVPLIYYGDEVGLAGAGDPDNRRPMPWTGLNAGQQWLLARMQALGQARKLHPSLRKGARTTLEASADVWAFQLTFGSDTTWVVLNRADQPATVSTLPNQPLTDVLTGDKLTGPQVQVPARGARILVP